MSRHVPAWVADAVFYQIFPDRFRRGERDWQVDPHARANRVPCGGNLAGIRKSIPYLKDLGVTAVYLTPIFHAASYHKYDTIDYYSIDPTFGTNIEFGDLVGDLHAHDIRVVLDGVFNHCGDRHPFFLDVVKKGKASPYWDWFTIRGDRVWVEPEPNYARWAGVTKMPEWNHANQATSEYLLDVVRHWIETYGIDGWRLDTTEYLPPDFVRAIYETAKSLSPDIYVLGEVMGLGTPWFRHQALDGVMHYKLWEAITKYLAVGTWDASTFWHSIHAHWYSYPEDANHGSFTLISSHDRPRFISACHGSSARLRLALAFQLTFPGAPSIYYVDEIGLQGGDDPDNRRCFPWDEAHWDQALRAEVRWLIALRKQEAVLRRSGARKLHTEGRLLIFERSDEQSRVLIALNAEQDVARKFTLPASRWTNLRTGETTSGDQTLAAQTYALFRAESHGTSRS